MASINPKYVDKRCAVKSSSSSQMSDLTINNSDTCFENSNDAVCILKTFRLASIENLDFISNSGGPTNDKCNLHNYVIKRNSNTYIKDCVMVDDNLTSVVTVDVENKRVSFQNGDTEVHCGQVTKSCEICMLSNKIVAFRADEKQEKAAILYFSTNQEAKEFCTSIRNILHGISHNDNHRKNNHNNADGECTKKCSVFEQRTEESSAAQYFQFYGYLSQQQNMLQDYVRTYTYQRAVLSNVDDFKDKVVLDVGAGSGILSFFAIQAGAKRVYAVEASNMAQCCETLVKNNGWEDRVVVLAGKVEEINVPEPVDTLISEPMGYMLLNERMLESFLHAKKFLKPQVGKIFPTRGDLHIAPFTDEALFLEQCGKANFWCQQSFHGVNLTSLSMQALKEYFKQPIVDTFHPAILTAKSVVWTLDFSKQCEADLHKIEIPLEFTLLQTGYVHGLAFWFDVAFLGSNQSVWLSTAPTEPLTHWYQVRCLLESPLFAYKGWPVNGRVTMVANKRQSYDLDIELTCPTTSCTSRNSLDLKNPCFRYTGQPIQPPPGQHTSSPTEAYWASQQLQQQQPQSQQQQQSHAMQHIGVNQAVNVANGLITVPLNPIVVDESTYQGMKFPAQVPPTYCYSPSP